MFTIQNNDSYKVWSRYNATRNDGSVLKLRIQDISWEKHKYDVLDFFLEHYVKDEAFHKASGICNNEEAKTEYKQSFVLYYEMNPPHVSVCCIDDDSKTKEILGMSLICEFKKGAPNQNEDEIDESLLPKTKELQNLYRILQATSSDKLFERYESYYEGRGISVRPDHRALGIANEFMRLRKQVCIDNNIQMTSAWMTSIGTQKAADKFNWKTFIDLPVDELARDTEIDFDADVPTFKLMYTTKD